MDVGRQLQCFVGRQPRTPQAETLVTEPAAFLCCPSRQPATRFRTIQPCGQILQRQDGLPALRPPCGLVRRGPLAVLYDLVQGDGLRLNLMPYPAQRRQGHRRGVQSPADAPLPAFDAMPERLFLGKAKQGKTAYLTKYWASILSVSGPPASQAIADAESSSTGASAASASSQVGASETNAVKTTSSCATIGCPASWASRALKHESASRTSVESHALLSIASGSCTAIIRVCS